jgi:hypothetical protein
MTRVGQRLGSKYSLLFVGQVLIFIPRGIKWGSSPPACTPLLRLILEDINLLSPYANYLD